MPRSKTDSTTEAQDAGQSDQPQGPREYVVLHGGVGPWWQGQIITDEHLNAVQGLKVQRLLDLGAIAPTGSEAAYQASRDGLATTTPEGAPVTDPVSLPETATGTPPESGDTPPALGADTGTSTER